MYKKTKAAKTTIVGNPSYEGEPIEQKIRRVVENKEPIEDIAEAIYTERKDGVQPAYDIRTDRWEIAAEAKDNIARSFQAKRENTIAERNKDKEVGKEASEGMKKEGETPSQAN